jgi:hypothetical protein
MERQASNGKKIKMCETIVVRQIESEITAIWQVTTTLYPQNKKSLEDNFIPFSSVPNSITSVVEVAIVSCSKPLARRLTETLHS